MMKNFVFILLTLGLISACSSYRTPPSTKKKVSSSKKAAKEVQEVPISDQTSVVWNSHNPDKIILILKNLDFGNEVEHELEEGLNRYPLTADYWQVVGFKSQHSTFFAMNTSQKFVFKVVKKKRNLYTGSIVIDCPTASQKHLHDLKKMKFFNRYHFSSDTALCEMIVGNDYVRVSKDFKKSKKYKGLNLSQGL